MSGGHNDEKKATRVKQEAVAEFLKYVPKDQGWAWMCVIGGFMVNVLVVGVAAKSFGILFVEFVERFNSSSVATSWVSALSQGLALLSAPFASTLAAHFGTRQVVCFGGLLTAAGFILCMFAINIEFLFFSYGVLVGIGSGLAYTPTIVLIGMYFNKRRALANGLTVAGSGVGNFVFPPIMQLMLDHYGLKGTLLILAGLMLNILVCGSLLRPLSFYSPSSSENKSVVSASHAISRQNVADETNDSYCNNSHTNSNVNDVSNHDTCHTQASAASESPPSSHINTHLAPKPVAKTNSSCCQCCPALGTFKFDWSLLKNPVFLVYGISLFFCFCGYPCIFLMIPPHCKGIGIPKQQAAYLVSIIGLLDLISRVFFGWFSDLNIVKKHFLFSGSLFVSGLACSLVPLATGFLSLAVVCGLIGTFAGSFVALIAPILADSLGVERLPSAFALAMMSQGMAFFIAPVLVGLLADLTGEWTVSFIFAGVSMVTAGIFPLFEPLAQRRLVRHAADPTKQTSDTDLEL